LLDILSESNVVIIGFNLFAGIDIIGKDLVTIFGEVDSHGEAHVAQPNEADFSEREKILYN
jgi:hypothetical protein